MWKQARNTANINRLGLQIFYIDLVCCELSVIVSICLYVFQFLWSGCSKSPFLESGFVNYMSGLLFFYLFNFCPLLAYVCITIHSDCGMKLWPSNFEFDVINQSVFARFYLYSVQLLCNMVNISLLIYLRLTRYDCFVMCLNLYLCPLFSTSYICINFSVVCICNLLFV